ncbi:hypothetical protein LPJ78_001287 [Coemansia sp. RSA 989]|nr:hypothetical protein BX667DRAFT_238574 [Coemansia mojavensis]KAJ1744013.1 hypothetical protein LPJ68_000397 [Coemansia sp. RSA 1086]KAJ1753483.1 hypothetical protein LPJ79_000342 [Coemansia sp. RSA 1821]KAJ1867074.1 hypothetical protein LPJ78_001287 [Coemansia sp. RSA 989]KAJ1875283.1 hypothetical protein LPJ55_000812 [Coemansia sp. RSA 990]KAJ2632375.1 hypothetical protein H4R22_001307 [Coemansia sp. RSA 1290]KAJ2651661.1 hypothetical protein IWW40_001561 [Coemansia sp. RSA 1250]
MNHHTENTTDNDALPTYEETLEAAPRKRYILKHPQLLSRTIHAVDLDTNKLAYSKKMKGLSSSKMVFFKENNTVPVWSCKRERQGFELVFSRPNRQPIHPLDQPLLPPDEDQYSIHISESNSDIVNGIATDAGANLLDNKPVDDNREYIHRENDAPPPAYEESDPAAEQQVKLTSTDPFPFAYDFTLPGSISNESSSAGSCQHRWLRNQEVKNPDIISPERPWSEFMCIEQSTGRMLAEVVHYSKKEPHLGTLIVNSDLEPDQHEFLVISALPVVEEYPVRHISAINISDSPF